ncbi:MAG TPA: hypothetical protein VMZ52_01505 [Bryobacteraceae bacterium]|nr:hypothetical protein [Bryobacteraceae bacterium]
MMFWVQNLFVLYSLIAITLALCLHLFVTLKRDLRRLQLSRALREKDLESSIQSSAAELRQLQAELREVEAKASLLVPPAPSKSGMNLNKRTQASRMLLRGESPDHVAAALGLPLCEVRLLFKIQRTMVN